MSPQLCVYFYNFLLHFDIQPHYYKNFPVSNIFVEFVSVPKCTVAKNTFIKPLYKGMSVTKIFVKSLS